MGGSHLCGLSPHILTGDPTGTGKFGGTLFSITLFDVFATKNAEWNILESPASLTLQREA